VTEREFGEAYVRLLPDLRRYVIRTIGNAADVDDIVQEAFLRMLRVDFQDWNDERWRRYLFRTASNLIIDRWRRRRFEHGGGAMPEASLADAASRRRCGCREDFFRAQAA